jgi:serine/threonine-protein kinase
MPASGPELGQATAMIDRAILIDHAKPTGFLSYFLCAKGLAEYRNGHFDESIKILSGDAGHVLSPAPQLVIAMAKFQLGQHDQARVAIAQAIVSRGWNPPHGSDPEVWIYHILRREAEALIVPRLPSVLRNEYYPADTFERLACLGMCEYENRQGLCARIWEDTFTAMPQVLPGQKYYAIFAAAQAGCGQGSDASKLSEQDRKHFRTLAGKWMQDALASFEMEMPGNADARRTIQEILSQWKTADSLAGIRDPGELAKLPTEEQAEFRALWDHAGRVLELARNND